MFRLGLKVLVVEVIQSRNSLSHKIAAPRRSRWRSDIKINTQSPDLEDLGTREDLDAASATSPACLLHT